MGSALLQSFAEGVEAFDEADRARGLAAIDRLGAAGLPGSRAEAWKYTSLRALEARRFALVDAAAAQRPIDASHFALPGVDGPRIVFVNGTFRGDLSSLDALPDGVALRFARSAGEDGRVDDAFGRLNEAFSRGGVQLHVAAGVRVTVPVHLVSVGTRADADVAWHLRHAIELGAGSELTLVEHYAGAGDHANFGNATARYALGAGSMLRVLQLQDDAIAASLVRRSEFVLAAAARLESCGLELGASLSRHELDVRLDGAGATFVSRGTFALRGRQHADTRLRVAHVGRDTRCDLLWRGVADQRARGVFHGAITVAVGADGADARLSNKNLLLSPHAEIDTQPVLEINADEVQASHGATVGQLDARALFYLRTRGLEESQARAMLTSAFCRVVLETVEPSTLREALDALLARQLPQPETAE